MNVAAGTRAMGSAALSLAYVAAGRYDAYWEDGLSPWDVAAGLLMVREAGGYVSDYSDRDKMFDNGEIVSGNDRIHASLLKTIRQS